MLENFSLRVVRCWNRLSTEAVNTLSLKGIEGRLDVLWQPLLGVGGKGGAAMSKARDWN